MGSSPSAPELAVTGSLTGDLVLFIVCLFVSAFFSASETALTALTEAKSRQLIEQKRAGARYLRLWLERPNRVLTTVLIGNNIVNTFTAALATLLSQQIFANAALSVAVGLTTVAILIVGEITPKTFAKHNAERLAPVAMALLYPLYVALWPIVVAFTWLSKMLVKLTGGEVSRTGPFITEEDIAFMIRLGQTAGVIEQDERELITNVFEFNDTLVKEVMVPRTDISGLALSSSLDTVLHEVRDHGHTRMPVYGENLDDVKGFFHTKDLLSILPDQIHHFQLSEYVRPALFVPELEKISELLKKFQRTQTHLAIVVDEYGGTAGIVSLEDLLEELVGDILDEHDDEEEAEFQKIDDGVYAAEGKASIYELGEAIGINFPEDDRYETLGGFMIAMTGKMPRRGERLEHDGWTFIVKEVEAKRIARVQIERRPGDVHSWPPTQSEDRALASGS